MEYVKRIIDDEISEQLKVCGAVQIRGPKWCGKLQVLNNMQKVF